MSKLDAAKISALKNLLNKNKIDGYVISDITDIRYFVGDVFSHAGEALVILHKKGVYITARSLYEAPVSAQFPEVKIEGCDSSRELKIIEAAKKLGLKKLAFDSSKEIYYIGKAYLKAGYKEIPGLINILRVSKTDSEIKTMKDSAAILYKAIKYIKKFLKPGVTESQIARILENYVLDNGGSAMSFTTIVAFGPGTSTPHHRTGDRKLKKNMAVMIDFGCYHKGYCSDITRTFWYGDKPAAEFEKIYKTVKEAHDKVPAEGKFGMSGKQLDAIARSHIEAAGYGKYFTHRTGHGIGIEPHEQADISQLNPGKIGVNYCFSVEPAIYLPGKFGVRYEDCYYMTEKGVKKIDKGDSK